MITQRQGILLTSIIESFIKTADPISSKFIEKSGFFGLSSATIRAEMYDLEDEGYLMHIYTSSGRIPTDRAYRYYVDNISNQGSSQWLSSPRAKYENTIRRAINRAGDDPREINRIIAQTLSDLSDNLVITGTVEEDDFYKIGLSNLFELPEFREFNRAFRLTSFFDGFESLIEHIENDFLNLGDKLARPADDVRVFIGRENPVKDIYDETVMFAQYNLPHDLTGSLTLVGPTRMDYKKNIALIKYMAEELNKLARKT